jgi:Mrp family chromosome partitioning ATPase/capsular polysaccharide biosynthesis protein
VIDYPPKDEGVGYVQALRHHWRAIVVLVAIAVGVAVAYSVTSANRYEAEAVLLVSPLPTEADALAPIGVFKAPSSGAASSVFALARLITTPEIVNGVKKRLGQLDLSRSSILKKVKVKPAQQSATVSIVGRATSAAGAARIANTFADVIIAERAALVQHDLAVEITRLERRLQGANEQEAIAIQERLAELEPLFGAGDPTVRILSRAAPPEKASSPGLALSVLIAFLAALLVGVAGAVGVEFLLPRLQSDDEVLRRLPILARIPRARRTVVRKYLKGRRALPADLWEAYRILRARLGSDGGGRESLPRSILVSSASPREGKTMTSVGLAIALAAVGRRVILIDCDFRKPNIARVFGLAPDSAGFAELLFARIDVEDVLVPAPGYGDQLRLIPAGSERPPDLVEPRRIKAVLDKLETYADVVVIDSPALTDFADPTVLADAVDAVVVAVRLGFSRRDRFAELRRLLGDRGINPAGFVITERLRARGRREAPPQVAADESRDERSPARQEIVRAVDSRP